VTASVLLALMGSAASAVADSRTGLVPNRLTYALWAAGGACLAARPAAAAADGIVTIALAAAIVVPLYARGLMGGGDAKLIIALAALDGPPLFWHAVFYSFAIGGGTALWLLLRQRRLHQAFTASAGLRPLPFAVFACVGQSAAMAVVRW
jgi:Flp pilus assembly protein protease CpaA